MLVSNRFKEPFQTLLDNKPVQAFKHYLCYWNKYLAGRSLRILKTINGEMLVCLSKMSWVEKAVKGPNNLVHLSQNQTLLELMRDLYEIQGALSSTTRGCIRAWIRTVLTWVLMLLNQESSWKVFLEIRKEDQKGESQKIESTSHQNSKRKIALIGEGISYQCCAGVEVSEYYKRLSGC